VASQSAPTPPTREQLLTLVNAERAKVGVAPLTEDAQIDAAAQYKSDDMRSANYFSHVNPATGKMNGVAKVFELTGNLCKYASENIVENVNPSTGKEFDNTASGSVHAWVNSPAHYAAMIDKKYSLTGFGVSGDYVTEEFCQA